MSLKEYLYDVTSRNRQTSSQILDEAARFLVEYGRAEIDTVENKEECIKAFYNMIPPSEAIKKKNSDAKKIKDEITGYREELERTNDKNERQRIRANIAEAQKRYARCKNEIRILSDFNEIGMTQEQQPERDWKQIVSLRGLRSIQYGTSSEGRRYPILLFRIYYIHSDKTIYDFGDVEVNFNPDFGLNSDRIAQRTRRTHYKDWGHQYPNYSYSHWEFCFGFSHDIIHKLVNERRYSDALANMVDCFNYVGPEHRENIPNCFPALEVDENVVKELDKYLKERGII